MNRLQQVIEAIEEKAGQEKIMSFHPYVQVSDRIFIHGAQVDTKGVLWINVDPESREGWDSVRPIDKDIVTALCNFFQLKTIAA